MQALHNAVIRGLVWAESPGVTPNGNGLPGLEEARKIVGALLTYGLIASVAGIAISAIVWAVASNSGNPHLAGRGKSGVLVAATAALLVGGAEVIVTFFSNAGHAL
jgi:hypothetical protein